MDMTQNEIALYLATLNSIIKITKTMHNPTIKKLRAMIEDEVAHVRAQIQKKDN
jgi:uncharacterized protein YajQ (UPF0234 family)